MLYQVPLPFPFWIDTLLGSFKPRAFLSYNHSQFVSMDRLPEAQPPSQGKNTSALTQTLDHNFQRLE